MNRNKGKTEKQMENELNPKALFPFSCGLYIVATAWEDKLDGQVANTVMQLTANPISIAVCLHKDNYTTELVTKSKKFSVSVFSNEVPLPFIGNFGFRSGRECDKFAKCDYVVTKFGLPVITEYTVAAIEAEVTDMMDIETHRLFVGILKSTYVISDGAQPLTYADYHKLKKGKAHINAPTVVFNFLR
ncbi:MAG: flavin reductase family protein [Synergistaceae bacterium]|jgi:flavin reductase (DIM6/NTAB) family NADH-FMN oxidoreductase RutF|nr:flavin reductase family protein [Synergistaceae bacterium]